MVRRGEIEHGERIADNAEAIWNWSSPAGRLRARRRAGLIADAAELGPGMETLEVGCGTGLFSRRFARSGSHLIAIDISPALLDKAREKQSGRAVTYLVDDAEQLSFATHSFDAVIGSSILHHLDMDRAVPELYRVLRPGGRLAFAEPNMMNPQITLERKVPFLRRRLGVSPEETAFFRWSLKGRLEHAGFREVVIGPFDFLHPAVPRPMIPLVGGMGRILEKTPMVREIAGSLLIRAKRPA